MGHSHNAIYLLQFQVFELDSIKSLLENGATAIGAWMGGIAGTLIGKLADWVMDLIGIKGGQDTIVSDSLAQNLERRSMMIH
nr:hypothetical protein [uncultured Campylobacter sp.]